MTFSPPVFVSPSHFTHEEMHIRKLFQQSQRERLTTDVDAHLRNANKK